MSLELNDAAKQKLNKELKKQGLKILRRSKKLAPVDTGRLRTSIALETVENMNGLISIKIGSNVTYAEKVEFGTVKQPSQPFLRPAIDQIVSEFNEKSSNFS